LGGRGRPKKGISSTKWAWKNREGGLREESGMAATGRNAVETTGTLLAREESQLRDCSEFWIEGRNGR